MAFTYPLFQKALYEEHLEEASFLYSQRLALRCNPEMPWRRLADFEYRLEAHVDALVVGAELALQTCRERAAAGDAGEIFAAVSVYCRQRRAESLSECLHQLDFADAARVTAVGDALKFELPDEWVDFIERAIDRDGRLASLLAPACAYRRLPVESALLRAMPAAAHLRPVIDALGLLRFTDARVALLDCLQHGDSTVRAAALCALTRLGDEDVLRSHYLVAHKEAWPHESLALGGDWSAVHVFEQLIAAGKADPQAVLCLGLLGQGSSLQALCDALTQPSLADAAALALYWMTGANLFEDVFVPAPIVEEEMSDTELRAWKEFQQVPSREDGTPFGETIRKVSNDRTIWNRWFAENAARFDNTLRYRGGDAHAPGPLLRHLEDERTDERLRIFTAHELSMRYGCEVNFDIDMPVSRQLTALRDIRAWVDSNAVHFTPGRWYFGARTQ